MTKNFQVGDCDCSPLFREGLPGPKPRSCSPKVKIYYITEVKLSSAKQKQEHRRLSDHSLSENDLL